jgi:ABC-type lipoprotein release transport system permease subunit
MHREDANDFFGMGGRASHALVYLKPASRHTGDASVMGFAGAGRFGPYRVRVEDRQKNVTRLHAAYGLAGGTGSVLLVVGLALAVPTLVVTSGLGMTDLRKEIGVMRATGWSTRDIVEKAAVENLAISLSAASLATLLAMAWMKGLNGALIAQFLISEVGLIPSIDIPFRISPAHALLGLCLALGLTQGGGIISAWASARALPGQSVR